MVTVGDWVKLRRHERILRLIQVDEYPPSHRLDAGVYVYISDDGQLRACQGRCSLEHLQPATPTPDELEQWRAALAKVGLALAEDGKVLQELEKAEALAIALLDEAKADVCNLTVKVVGLEQEAEALKAEVREWFCEACRTVYAGFPNPGSKVNILCPKCGGLTGPRNYIEMRLAAKEADALRQQVASWKMRYEASQEALRETLTEFSKSDCGQEIIKLRELLSDIRQDVDADSRWAIAIDKALKEKAND